MSRAVAFRAVALLLLAAAAFAQPMVKAPLLNRVGFVSGGTYAQATLPTAAAGGFAFTTIYNSSSSAYTVIALNLTSPSSTGEPAFSMVLPWVPSSIFAATHERIGVVCNDTVMFFGANWTDVWSVGNVTVTGVTFDLHSISTSVTQYDLPTVGWWGSVFIGTQNKSTTDSSAIYHLNATTGMIVNHTMVPYYTSNYRLQFDMATPDVVYALARRYSGGSDNFILPISISNMSVGTPIDTTTDSYNAVRFNVAGGVAAVIDYYGYWYFLSLTNGSLLKQGQLNCNYGTVNFEPAMIGGHWFVSCGGYIGVFDNVTLALQTTLTSPSGMGGFTAAAAENWSPMSTVVVAAGNNVYVINGTVPALFLVASITTLSGNTPTPMAALFVFNTSIVQVSYANGVVGFDTMTGKTVGQITNVNPVGWGIWLQEAELDIVSSTSGPALASYNNRFNDTLPGYVAQLPPSTFYTYRAFIANGTTGYYFTYYNFVKVNLTTGAQIGTTISMGSGSMSVGPVIVGDYVCANKGSTTYCITAADAAPVQASTCTPDARTPFSVVNGVLYVLCYTGGDIYSWAVSPTSVAYSASGYVSTTPAVVGTKALVQTSYSTTPAVVGTKALVQTSYSTLTGYTVPLTSSSPTSAFTITNTVPMSNVATVGGNFVFMGYAYTLAADKFTATTNDYMLYVYSQSGSKVSSIVIPDMSTAVAVATRSGDQFGSMGWAFVFNGTAMAGVNLNSMQVVYQTKVDFQTGIQDTPVVTSQGGICFYGASYNRFYMYSAFNGELAWWAPASSGSNSMTPIEASGAIYYSTGTSVIGADIFTGMERTAVGFGSTTINGFAVLNNSATNQSSIFVTTQNDVLVATTAYIMPSTGYFAGGGGSGSGDDGSKKSMAWIAGVVIGVLVAVILVVVIIKKKGSGSTGDTDYVPMNPATQV